MFTPLKVEEEGCVASRPRTDHPGGVLSVPQPARMPAVAWARRALAEADTGVESV